MDRVRKGFQSDREYQKIHKRIKAARGKASEQSCIDCGKQAVDWSYTQNSDIYDTLSYVPRCRSCHSIYDGSNIGKGLRKDTWPISMSMREIEEVIARRALKST